MSTSSPAQDELTPPAELTTLSEIHEWMARTYNSNKRWKKTDKPDRPGPRSRTPAGQRPKRSQPEYEQAVIVGWSEEAQGHYATYLPWTEHIFDAFYDGLEGNPFSRPSNEAGISEINWQYGKRLREKHGIKDDT